MAESSKKEAEKGVGVKTAKNGIIYVIGQVAGSFAILALLVGVARLLKPAEFGLYAIVIAFYTLIGIAANFSVGTAMRKRLPEEKNEQKKSELISNGYALGLSFGLVVAILFFLLSGFIATNIYHEPALTSSLQLASILTFFFMLFNLTIATLVALDKVVQATVIDIIYSIIQPIAAISLVILGYGVFGAVVGLAISIIIGSILGLFLLSKEIKAKLVKPTKAIMKELANFSFPVAISNVALLGPQNFAILLLGIFASHAVVGNYNVAYELSTFVGIIITSNTFILLPIFSAAFSKEKEQKKLGNMYNNSIYYTLLLLLPLVAYVVAVSHPLLYLLFSNSYGIAPFYFAIMAIGTVVGIIGSYAGTLIISYGDTKRFMIYQIATVIIELALLFILTPLFNVAGTLIAIFVLSPIIFDLIYIRALNKQFTFRHEFKKMIRLIVPFVITMGILYLITISLGYSKISIIIDLIALVLIYTPLLAIFGALEKENAEFLNSITKSYKIGSIVTYILTYGEKFRKYRIM